MANEKPVKDEDPKQGGSFVRNEDGSLAPNKTDAKAKETTKDSKVKKD